MVRVGNLNNLNRIKGVRPRPITCDKGGELKQLKSDKGYSTQAVYLWSGWGT